MKTEPCFKPFIKLPSCSQRPKLIFSYMGIIFPYKREASLAIHICDILVGRQDLSSTIYTRSLYSLFPHEVVPTHPIY